MTRSWTPSETLLLRQLIESGKNDAQIAKEFQKGGVRRTYKAVQRKRQREGWHALVPPAPGCCRRFTNSLTVEGNQLILFDPHWPFADADFINRLVDLALAMGIRNVGIGGDLADESTFSHFGRDIGIEWRDERAAIKQGVKALRMTFDELTICLGNHDRRVLRALDNVVDEFDWVDTLHDWFPPIEGKKLNITPYYFYHVLSGGERFRITHPKNSSVRPTTVPLALCHKYHEHIISGHNHLNGKRRDEGDRFWVLESGMCADRELIKYLMMEDNRRPMAQQGAVIIKGGTPLLIWPQDLRFYQTLMTRP